MAEFVSAGTSAFRLLGLDTAKALHKEHKLHLTAFCLNLGSLFVLATLVYGCWGSTLLCNVQTVNTWYYGVNYLMVNTWYYGMFVPEVF